MGSLIDNQNDFYREGGKGISNAFTSFNELTVTSSDSLFDLKSNYGITSLRDKTTVTGSGTVTNTEGLYVLNTGATGGSSAILESVDRGRYIAGFEGVPGIAVGVDSLPTGSDVARWGYFDENDGFGTGVDANGFFTFIRSGGVERVHRSGDWAEPQAANDMLGRIRIYRYPFRWYGSGPAMFEVGGDSQIILPDILRYDAFAGEGISAITERPSLKIRAEVEGGGDFQIKVGGRQFFILGDYSPVPRFTSEFRLEQSVGTTFVPLISCQQTTGLLADVSTKLAGVSLLVSGAPIVWQIRLGATVATPAAAPNNIPAGEFAMLWDNTEIAMTGGHKIYEDLAPASTGSRTAATQEDLPALPLPEDQPITLCARSVTGTATVTSSFSIREEW